MFRRSHIANSHALNKRTKMSPLRESLPCCLKVFQKDSLPDFLASSSSLLTTLHWFSAETWNLGSTGQPWQLLGITGSTKKNMLQGLAPFPFVSWVFPHCLERIHFWCPEWISSPLYCQHAPNPSKSRANVGVAMPGWSQNCTSRSPKHQHDKRKLPASTNFFSNVSIWFNAAPRDAHENQSVALFQLLDLSIGAKSATIPQQQRRFIWNISWDV